MEELLLLVRVGVDLTLKAVLAVVGIAAARHPLLLAAWALEVSEGPLGSLVRRQPWTPCCKFTMIYVVSSPST